MAHPRVDRRPPVLVPPRASLALLALLGLVACSPTARDAAPTAAPTAPSADERPPPSPSPSTYLALGDSVASGVGAPDGQGYVPLLGDLLRERLGCDDAGAPGCPLTVRELAVAGATTSTLLRDQLPSALGLLRSEPDVRLVTVTIGGNDVFEPVVRGCARAPESSACRSAVAEALARADAGLDDVLRAVGEAAGPETTVAVMTYYDPVPACRLAPLAPLAERVLEGDGGRPGLNDVLRDRAAEHGAVVVETADRLSAPGDFVGGDDCLHPAPSGHRAIAEAFDEVVGPLVAGR